MHWSYTRYNAVIAAGSLVAAVVIGVGARKADTSTDSPREWATPPNAPTSTVAVEPVELKASPETSAGGAAPIIAAPQPFPKAGAPRATVSPPLPPAPVVAATPKPETAKAPATDSSHAKSDGADIAL